MSVPPLMHVFFWGYFALWLIAEFFLIRSKLHWGLKVVGFIALSQLFYSTPSYRFMFGDYEAFPGKHEQRCAKEMEKHQKFFNDVSTGFGGLPPEQAGKRTGEYMAQQVEELARSGCNEVFMKRIQEVEP